MGTISTGNKFEADISLKRCKRCDQEFPLSVVYFRTDNHYSDGLSIYCKNCASTTIRSHYSKFTRKEKGEKGQIGVICPIWETKCGVCNFAEACWRID